MLKKYMIAILILTLVFSSVAFGFNDTDETFVYIISPEVGEAGKAIINNDLFISVYVQSEESLYLELIKKETPVFNFETEENKTFIELDVTEPIEEKVLLDEAVTPVYTKEEIYVQYQVAKTDLAIVKKSYEAAKNVVSKIPSLLDETASLYDPSYVLTEEDILNQEHLEKMTKEYSDVLSDFYFWEEKYLELFETVIFQDVEMLVDEVLPYFEYNVDGIAPGHYTLSVVNGDGDIIEKLTFEVVSEDIIVDEIIEDLNFFNNIIDDAVFN